MFFTVFCLFMFCIATLKTYMNEHDYNITGNKQFRVYSIIDFITAVVFLLLALIV